MLEYPLIKQTERGPITDADIQTDSHHWQLDRCMNVSIDR